MPFACKKKDNSDPDNNSNSTTTGSTTTTGGTTTGGTTTGGTTTGGTMATNTGTWTYGGNTYSVDATYGGVSWGPSGSVTGQQVMSALNSFLTFPRQTMAFEFTSSNPATGTYTLVDFNNSAAMATNFAKATIAIQPSSGPQLTYGYTNATGTNTISVVNTNSVVTVRVNNITYSSIGNATITPQTYVVSGAIAK